LITIDRLKITAGDGAQEQVVLARTGITGEPLMFPLALVMNNGGGMSTKFDWDWLRYSTERQSFKWPDILFARPQEGTTEKTRQSGRDGIRPIIDDATIEKLLADKGRETFPPMVSTAVVEWTMQQGYRKASSKALGMMERVAADLRFRNIPQLFSTLEANPEVLKRTLPALFKRLEAPIAPEERSQGYYDFDRATIGYALRRIDRDDLAAYASRIVAIVKKYDLNWTGGLVVSLARLDIDTTELIRQRLSAQEVSIQDAAATAACLSPPDRQARLKDDLVARLTSAFQDRRSEDRHGSLVRALIRMGERQRVVDAAGGKEKFAKFFVARSTQSLQAGFPTEQCG
jgi:hypothetical protein